jgi:hypothetical protein
MDATTHGSIGERGAQTSAITPPRLKYSRCRCTTSDRATDLPGTNLSFARIPEDFWRFGSGKSAARLTFLSK